MTSLVFGSTSGANCVPRDSRALPHCGPMLSRDCSSFRRAALAASPQLQQLVVPLQREAARLYRVPWFAGGRSRELATHPARSSSAADLPNVHGIARGVQHCGAIGNLLRAAADKSRRSPAPRSSLRDPVCRPRPPSNSAMNLTARLLPFAPAAPSAGAQCFRTNARGGRRYGRREQPAPLRSPRPQVIARPLYGHVTMASCW